MRARPILPVTIALAAVLAAAPARPVAAAPGGPRVVSRHAILVDAGGGEVLWGRGSRVPRPPASLTKMLTALAVRASLDLDGRVAASRVAATQPARRLAAAATRHGRTLIAIVLDSPDNAADAGRMLDWGFGRGRSARTGLRLPAYVAPASVATLLVRPPGRWNATGRRPEGSAAQGSGWAAARAATGAGATAALLAAIGLVMRRRRRGQA
jgi:D-alanyl-D-alanine carboxypeptidase